MAQRPSFQRSPAAIGYCLACGLLAAAWVLSGRLPVLVLLWAVTFPLGYFANLPLYLIIGMAQLALGITDESSVSVPIAAIVCAVGYTAIAAINVVIFGLVREPCRTASDGSPARHRPADEQDSPRTGLGGRPLCRIEGGYARPTLPH